MNTAGHFGKNPKKPKLQNRILERTKMVVPVRILVEDKTGAPNVYLAHTLDASSAGTRLGGFHGQLEMGQTVTVQYQHRRSVFRVIWTGKLGTPQATQIGLSCLEPAKNIWNIEEDVVSGAFDMKSRSSEGIEIEWAEFPAH